MLSDRKASELISKSMGAALSEEEAREIGEHVAAHPESKAFERMSRLIQDSVANHVTPDALDADDQAGLSGEAKERLRQSVREALRTAKQGDTESVDSDTSESLHRQIDGEQPTRRTRSRFTLLRQLARGGLGTVWIARDEKLKRTVAVKEMNAEALESPKAWVRFQREAEITGHLEHPNVVPLYQYGEDPESGLPFYSMRFVGKRTLADAIIEYHERRQAGDADDLELHRLLVIFLQVCQAIAYVHSRGVIHRDLKPENIAIDSFGQVVVLDWGLATFVEGGDLGAKLEFVSNTGDSALGRTLDGDIVGTPLYMSPEQAAGDLSRVDEPTDVYGLGAILFAILTGSAPHELSHAARDGDIGIQELLMAIAESEASSPRQFNHDIACDLDAICRKAMARKQHARHASVKELADEIERWLAGQREKPRQYDRLRMEGRELRANLQAVVSDLGRNVRFMANLPPIQGLVEVRTGQNDELESVWRERLTKIFQGLLRANADYTAVAFCRAQGSSSTELVRVERHRADTSNLRAIPISRLNSIETCPFIAAVMRQKPDEVFTALAACAETGDRRLEAGAPVFDERTEEPFGYVLLECNLQNILEVQLRERVRAAKQVVLAESDGTIWVCEATRRGREEACRLVSSSSIELEHIIRIVERDDEFIDDTDLELYAARIELADRLSSLTLVLSSKPAR